VANIQELCDNISTNKLKLIGEINFKTNKWILLLSDLYVIAANFLTNAGFGCHSNFEGVILVTMD